VNAVYVAGSSEPWQGREAQCWPRGANQWPATGGTKPKFFLVSTAEHPVCSRLPSDEFPHVGVVN
jgi:hypothetical protein